MLKTPVAVAEARKDLDSALDDVAHQLRSAAESAQDGAQSALAKAAHEVARAAASLRQQATSAAKDVAAGVGKDVKEHPVVSMAAVIAAAAALVGIIVATRPKAE